MLLASAGNWFDLLSRLSSHRNQHFSLEPALQQRTKPPGAIQMQSGVMTAQTRLKKIFAPPLAANCLG
jgi:hypothetical protein